MKITKIVIEGFKSYKERVVLENFDDSFNAITGLNGTGKSNILDSICFVLGNRDVKLARLTSLKDYVFMSGQQGVLEAKVSITFRLDGQEPIPPIIKNILDNTPDYKYNKDMTITRTIRDTTTKYAISGKHVANEPMRDMFNLVGLNINHPHFLIMQGRITKVLMMKPKDTLEMVEEAIGTSRVQAKLDNGRKMMIKLNHDYFVIQLNYQENLLPFKLKCEKHQKEFDEFTSMEREHKKKVKVVVAVSYLHQEEEKVRHEKLKEDTKDKINELEQEVQTLEETNEDLEKQIKVIEKDRDKETKKRLAQLDSDHQAKFNDYSSKAAEKKDVKNGLVSKEKALEDNIKERTSFQKKLSDKETLLGQLRTDVDKLGEDLDKATRNHQNLIKVKDRILCGDMADFEGTQDADAMTSMDEKVQRLKDEVLTLKNEKKGKSTQKVDISRKLEQSSRLLVTAKQKDASTAKNKKMVQKLEQDIAGLEKQLFEHPFNPEEYDNTNQELNQLLYDMPSLEEQVTKFEHSTNNLVGFRPGEHYRVPNHKGFKQQDIMGQLGNYVDVQDTQYEMVVEKVCGGNLRSVIVHNPEIVKILIDQRCLKYKYKLISIPTIQSRPPDRNLLKRMQKKYPKYNIQLAIDLVTYDPALQPVMQMVFGSTLIAPNIDIAQIICEDAKVKVFDLDGNFVSPDGTGAAGRNVFQNNLAKFKEHLDMMKQHEAASDRIQELQQVMSKLNSIREPYMRLKERLVKMEQEMEDLKRSIEISATAGLEKDIDAFSSTLDELNVFLLNVDSEIAKKEAEINELEQMKNNQQDNKERDIKMADKNILEASKKKKEIEKIMNGLAFKAKNLENEVELMRSNFDNLTTTEGELRVDITNLKTSLVEIEPEVIHLQAIMKESKEKYDQEKKALQEKEGSIMKIKNTMDKNVNTCSRLRHEVTNQHKEVIKIDKGIKEAANNVRKLVDSNKWLIEEKKNFDDTEIWPMKAPGFDFHQIKERVGVLEKRIKELKNTVDMELMKKSQENKVLLDNCEKGVGDLKILGETITKIIDWCEMRKKKKLEDEFPMINNHFNNIFSCLLPGNEVRLVPLAGKTIHDGIIVQVALNKCWLDGLTPLSGGQKSLVSLSLILALLRIKPAPIYILDEIDAALDFNHTANIGKMIKENFQQSQFIIVSLKNELFKKASCLFKTNFINGRSIVERQSND